MSELVLIESIEKRIPVDFMFQMTPQELDSLRFQIGISKKGRLANLEKKYDTKFRVVFDAIRKLMEKTPVPAKRQVGFVPDSRSV